MRLKQLYTILLLCCVNICFAQNKLFDKYADMDDVTSVYISKKMFQMMPVILSYKEQGKTILICSHSAEDISVLCDTVHEMDKGVISEIKG